MNVQFNHVVREDGSNITVVVDGVMFVADDQHPLFDEIVAAAVDDDPAVADLFDASRKAAARFENVTERVTVANSRVYVDQTEVDDVFAEQIIRFMNEGNEDFKPLALFLEKAYSNVNPAIRENLSRWLQGEDFTILPNGNILGYRGLTADYRSKHAGPGVVNGEQVNGQLDNSVGNVLEMDATLVEHTPDVGCASGLHVGTHAYATDWAGNGGVVVSVEVDPRHIRSVPYDCNSAKMRVSKYRVLDTITAKVESAFAGDEGKYNEYTYSDDECPDCGEPLDDDYCFDCDEYK